MRACAISPARSRALCSFSSTQADLSCSSASTSPTGVQRGALTLRPSGLTDKPMVRRLPRLNS
jgi:hypothetical protein